MHEEDTGRVDVRGMLISLLLIFLDDFKGPTGG